VFRQIVALLRKHYRALPPHPPKTALELVLWENVAYLVDDARRAAAFARLERDVGTRPEEILAASDEALYTIAEMGGMHPQRRVAKLRTIAETVMEEFDGDLDGVLELPTAKAKRALKKFPGIGDPGAEKILLFTKTAPVFAIESNGLRVLLRLGYGKEQKSYAATYRSVRTALEDELPSRCDALISAHRLLRQHGQELCRRSHPRCEACPLRNHCPHGR